MKNNSKNPTRPMLGLSRETVRLLSARDLVSVAGGGNTWTCLSTGASCHRTQCE